MNSLGFCCNPINEVGKTPGSPFYISQKKLRLTAKWLAHITHTVTWMKAGECPK